MEIIRKLLITAIFFVSMPVFAADHTIEMLSSSDGQMMVFKPAVLKINPGDTVTWKASNPGHNTCLLYTSPSPRDRQKSRMPSSA